MTWLKNKKKKLREELAQQKKLFETTIGAIAEGLITTDKYGRILFMNPEAERMTGWKNDEALNQPLEKIYQVTNEETGELLENIVSRMLINGMPVAFENNTILHTKTWDKTIISNNGLPLFDTEGNLTGAVLVFRSVTGQKKAAQQLKESEEKYWSLIEQASDGVIIYSVDGAIYNFNQAAYTQTGYTHNEFEKLQLTDLLFGDKIISNSYDTDKMQAGETVFFTRTIKRKDGSRMDAEINARVLPDGRNMAFIRDITQQKNAEQQLAESEKNLHHVLSSASDSFYVIDRKCNVTLINKTAAENLEKAWGKPVTAGSNILTLIPNENDEPTRGSLVKAFAGKQVDYELHHVVKDLPSWVLVSYIPVRDDNGIIVGAYITTRDITERKKTEAALKEINERYELATKATSDMVWDWDLITGEVYRSKDGWRKIFKMNESEEVRAEEDWETRIHPEDRDRVKMIKEEMLQSPHQHLFEIECRVLMNDGSYAYIQDRGYIMRNEQGRPVRLVGAAKNITKRKIVEEELKKLSLIAKETTNAVIITDAEQRIQWVNEAFTRITEFELAEVIGKRAGDFLQGPETAPGIIRYMRRKISNMQSFVCDVINYSKSGRRHWIRIQCQPEFDTEGKLTGFFFIQSEITKEKEAEEALKSSEERYRRLFNNNPDSIFILAMDDLKIVEVNDTAVRQYGYSKEEFVQFTISGLWPAEDNESEKEFVKHVKENTSSVTGSIWKHLNKAGEEMYMNIDAHQILYQGKIVIMAMAGNVTEKKMLEEQLENERIWKQQQITDAVLSAQENERQEIGRELHDNINQILTSSRLYLGMAKTDAHNVAGFIDETDNLINLAIREIRTLSHSLIPPSLQTSALIDALNDIIETISETTQITVQKKFNGFEDKHLTDKFKLTIYRIVQEQFNNIVKYAKADMVYLELLQQDNQILLSIQDNGVGFDTTSNVSGVGLMNIKTRASLFNGVVEIISSPGNGCGLKVIFNPA